LNVALVQICSTPDVQQNCARAIEQIERAAAGARAIVLLPENVCYIRREDDRIAWSESLDGGVVAEFCQVAQRLQICLLVGSILERIPDSEKIYNTALLIGPAGKVSAVYRKLHLFDRRRRVLPDGQVLNESRFVEKGSELPSW
jgi:predicted amidohydrolase